MTRKVAGYSIKWEKGAITFVHQQCCVFFFMEIEAHNHFFFFCAKVKEIWTTIFLWLNCISFGLLLPRRKSLLIWLERNNNVEEVIDNIKRIL
jgi:hypothetical protein